MEIRLDNSNPLYQFIKGTKSETSQISVLPTDMVMKIFQDFSSTTSDCDLIKYGLYGELKKRILSKTYRGYPDISKIIIDGKLDILVFLHQNNMPIYEEFENPLLTANCYGQKEIFDWYMKVDPSLADSEIFNVAIGQADYVLMRKIWKINPNVVCYEPTKILELREIEVLLKRSRCAKKGKNIPFKNTVDFLYNNIPKCKRIYIQKHGVRKMQ